MNREVGYYWVRTSDFQGRWLVAEWNGERFLITGSTYGYIAEEMEEVGQRIVPMRVAAYVEGSTPSSNN